MPSVPHWSRKIIENTAKPTKPANTKKPATSTNTKPQPHPQTTQIYEGTNQICRMVAGRQILKEGKKH